MQRVRVFFVWVALASACAAGSPTPRAWGDTYRVILWCGERVERNRTQTNALAAACRELGVTTLMTTPAGDPSPWLGAGFDYYVENIVSPGLCLKFRSSVTDWNRFVTEWAQDRTPAAFVRDYSLSDPAWRAEARAAVRQTAARHAPFAPRLYDLRDELSVTVSANPFDYDFSAASLAAFRLWLQKRYASLEALNAAWLTAYPAWDAVVPFSTDEIKARMSGQIEAQGRKPDWSAVRETHFSPDAVRAAPARWNLAPWCDFRTFMDDVLAETLADLRDAAHGADPDTPVGIEGTQMPSAWGGYDLWKLSRVLDWAEPYDICAARAVFGSFMRGKPLLATYGERDPAAVSRRMWHRLLEGDRGAILWWSEDLLEGDGDKLRLSPKGHALAPVVREMQTPLARRLLQAERVFDPVAVHYSQPSIQLAWLFESFADGATWPRRFSSYEAQHNRHAALRADLWRQLREAGWSPQFVSYAEIEDGALDARGFTVCLLPDSFALSDRETEALQAFAARPGKRLLYTGEPGTFHANGTPRAEPPLAASKLSAADLVASLQTPKIHIEPSGTGVSLYRYRTAEGPLFALEQRQQGQLNEDVTQSAAPDGGGATVTVTFAYGDSRPLFDLQTGRSVGANGTARVEVTFERPALLGFAPGAP